MEEKTMYRIIRVDYVCDGKIDTDEIEQIITNELCAAGNSMIGDNLTNALNCETKIQIVSDCGASV